MNQLRPFELGIFDWGIGGLSVYNALRQSSMTSVCYFSDSGFTPYGKLSQQDLEKRLIQVINWFKKKEINTIVIACNAASTAADFLRNEFPQIKIFDVITVAIQQVVQSGFKSVGVIGGKRTIESEIYPKTLTPLGIHIEQKIAQPLSALVELGIVSGIEVENNLQEILNSFVKIEALLLACTHYPALSPEIKKKKPNLVLLDPAKALVAELGLQARSKTGPEKNVEFFTTGNPQQMKESAKKAFALEISTCNFLNEI
jgi:glutamate racemase